MTSQPAHESKPSFCTIEFFSNDIQQCERKVWQMVVDGVLPAIKNGRSVRIDYHKALEVIRSLPAPSSDSSFKLPGAFVARRPRGRPRKVVESEAA